MVASFQTGGVENTVEREGMIKEITTLGWQRLAFSWRISS
jgi:hypothetical protein